MGSFVGFGDRNSSWSRGSSFVRLSSSDDFASNASASSMGAEVGGSSDSFPPAAPGEAVAEADSIAAPASSPPQPSFSFAFSGNFSSNWFVSSSEAVDDDDEEEEEEEVEQVLEEVVDMVEPADRDDELEEDFSGRPDDEDPSSSLSSSNVGDEGICF